jgi:hypothetical protein
MIHVLKTALASIALVCVAPYALAQETTHLTDTQALIGQIASPIGMQTAQNARVNLRHTTQGVAFSAQFETVVGGQMLLVADGPVDSHGDGALRGHLVAGGVPFPATVWIKARSCDNEGCWTMVEAEASNASGEVVNVLISGR